MFIKQEENLAKVSGFYPSCVSVTTWIIFFLLQNKTFFFHTALMLVEMVSFLQKKIQIKREMLTLLLIFFKMCFATSYTVDTKYNK